MRTDTAGNERSKVPAEAGAGPRLVPVARLRLPEKLARTLVEEELPELDRPLRFVVPRGQRGAARGDTLEELQEALERPWTDEEIGALSRHRDEARERSRRDRELRSVSSEFRRERGREHDRERGERSRGRSRDRSRSRDDRGDRRPRHERTRDEQARGERAPEGASAGAENERFAWGEGGRSADKERRERGRRSSPVPPRGRKGRRRRGF